MVEVALASVHLAGEAPDAVVDRDNVGIKASDQVIEGIQRRYLAAGGYVNVDPEGRYRLVRVEFGICVDCEMALVEMSADSLPL